MSNPEVIPNGGAIERRRKARSLTQKLLAERCGVGVHAIQRAETSKRLDREALKAIAMALHCPADDLLSATERNKQIVTRAFTEIFNEDRYELIDELYAEDLLIHDPSHGALAFGRDQLRNLLKLYRFAMPDHQFSIEHLIAEGNLVNARWRDTGTHRGTFLDRPPTGKRIYLEGITMLELEDGKIREVWQIWNYHELLEAIGLMAPPNRVTPSLKSTTT